MKSILLVDDNPTFCSVWRDLCEAAGYEVHEAHSGHKALSMLKHSPSIGLVVTDYCMKPMTGYELIRHMREHDETRSIPIVMLTGTDKAIHDLVAHEGVTVFNKVARTGLVMQAIEKYLPLPKPAVAEPEPSEEMYKIVHTRYHDFIPREYRADGSHLSKQGHEIR